MPIPLLLRRSGCIAVLGSCAACAGAQRPVATPATADVERSIVQGALGARMDTLVRRAAAFGFSGQVLVARDDSVLLHRAYGAADRARGVPMRLETRIGIASASKQFAAAAILQLASTRTLSLDDSLGAHLDAVPPDKRAITLRQVVSHTAGLAGGFADDFEDASLESIAARVLERPLRWAPGRRWGYSTEGYAVLALVAQRAARQPWDSIVHRALLRPAAMSRSGTWRDAWGEGDVAHAYTGIVDNGSPASWPPNWRVAAAGDVVSSAADLRRWHLALAAGRLLPRARVAEYFRPLAPIDSTSAYGFGLFHDRVRGTSRIEHGGDTDIGYNAGFYRYPDVGALVIVVSNARDWLGRSMRAAVEAELESLLLGVPPDSVRMAPAATPFTREERASLAGSWRQGPDALHLIDDGWLLWAAAEGQEAVNTLTSRDGAQAAQLAGANERTLALLAAVVRQDSAATQAALADTVASRVAGVRRELARLRERHGAMREARVLGSILRGGSAWTTVRVVTARHETLALAFRWADGGRGPLSAIQPGSRFPVMLAVARAADGALLAHDVVAGRVGRPLQLQGAAARRLVAASGWSVTFTGTEGWNAP